VTSKTNQQHTRQFISTTSVINQPTKDSPQTFFDKKRSKIFDAMENKEKHIMTKEQIKTQQSSIILSYVK